MSSPYRAGAGDLFSGPPQAPRDTGIVSDIVGQFADRYAFLRELVQNAIDAESRAVEVAIVYDADDELIRASVKDEGVGMPPEIISERLLVLFRSTKEADDTKIGKFGVGFASVLALDPSLVKVTSAHGGASHTLHLFADLSYELFETGRTQRCGTTVEIEVPLAANQARDFIDKSLAALRRWCRHASVPIYFRGEALGLHSIPRCRIDQPLALEGVVAQVSGRSPDGQLTAIVGVPADGKPYAGFFNHGLTLYETSDPLAGKIAFKVQDSRLGHTLSRDNVRRDRRYELALDFVRQLADRELRVAVTDALERAAESGDSASFADTASAVVRAELDVGWHAWPIPIVVPINRQQTVPLAVIISRGAYGHGSRSPITERLAQLGVPVVVKGRVSRLVETLMAASLTHASSLTMVTPRQASAHQREIIEATLSLLDRVHRAPTGLVIADVEGARNAQPFLSCQSDEVGESFFVADDEADRDPFALFRRRAIAINARSAIVESIFARGCIGAASSALARQLLLRSQCLVPHRSEILCELELEAALGDRS